MNNLPHHIDIPRVFYSDETESPFQRCLGCDKFLLDGKSEYLIEKAFRQYEGYEFRDTVFEYAMCLNCVGNLHEAMSEESMRRVQLYFDERVDLFERNSNLLNREPIDLDDWISNCIVKGTPVSSLPEYQIYGFFEGDQLFFSLFPYAVGGEAIDEVAALLSNKTLGEIDGFMEDHFGLPPELRKLLLDKALFI